MAKEKKRKFTSIGSAINDMLGVKPPPETPVSKKQRKSKVKVASGAPVDPLAEFGEFAFLALGTTESGWPLHGDMVDGEAQIPYK